MEAAIPIQGRKLGVRNADMRRWGWRRGCLLGDEEDIDGGGFDLVEVGQRRHAGVGRVDAAVELESTEWVRFPGQAGAEERTRGS